MTPEEKNALISFFGNVHSISKQTDSSVVERSRFISPISDTVKRELENVLTAEQAAAQIYSAPAAPAIPFHTAPVANEILTTHSPPPPLTHPQNNEIQLELNFTRREADNIIDILKRIESKITKIVTILDNDRKAIKPKKESNLEVSRLSSTSK